jgi:hypothetical protein
MDQPITHVLGHKITQVGSGMAVSSGLVGWLTENHIILTSAGVMVGISVGLTGIYMQVSRNSREVREHKARMRGMKDGGMGSGN